MCNTSKPGDIFSGVVSFDFPVEGHTIYARQRGRFCFVSDGFIQGFKNCVRIDRLCRIGDAALNSWSVHEVRRPMLDIDFGCKGQRQLHGVLELPYIAGPGIPWKGFRDISGYRRNDFLEFDDNTSVACNTISSQFRDRRFGPIFPQVSPHIGQKRNSMLLNPSGIEFAQRLSSTAHCSFILRLRRSAFDNGQQPSASEATKRK